MSRKTNTLTIRIGNIDRKYLDIMCSIYGLGKSSLIRKLVRLNYQNYHELRKLKKCIDKSKEIE